MQIPVVVSLRDKEEAGGAAVQRAMWRVAEQRLERWLRTHEAVQMRRHGQLWKVSVTW